MSTLVALVARLCTPKESVKEQQPNERNRQIMQEVNKRETQNVLSLKTQKLLFQTTNYIL